MRKLNYATTEKLLFTVAQLFYEQGRSKTEIAKELRVSVTHASRLLREALSRGLVEISVRAPRHEAIERRLAATFGLREARVISSVPDETSLRAHLGAEAARMFGSIVRDGLRIGIGSGRTMYELINALPERAIAIEILPLALIADQSMEVRSIDATTLVNTLWFKFRPAAKALKMNLAFPAISLERLRSLLRTLFQPAFLDDFQQQLKRAYACFFSASQLRKDSQILDITGAHDVSFDQLKELGVVGDYLFRTVDSEGRPVSVGLDEYVLGVTLDTLREISSNPEKWVVLVAGGREKTVVIEAGLSARYFNTLITDDETAEYLLRTQERRSPGGSLRRALPRNV